MNSLPSQRTPRSARTFTYPLLAAIAALGAAPATVGQSCEQQQKLVASDATANDQFGNSVAMSGDTAVVGSVFDDNAGGFDAGAAYVYVRTGPPGREVWTQQAKLMASDAAAQDWFGFSVAVSGDTVVVGAESNVGTFSSAGAAYVFVRTGPPGSEIWTQQAKLTASDVQSGDQFGYSVALWGDTVVVGAKDGDTPTQINTGTAYVFVRTGGVWTQQAELIPLDGLPNDQFGWSVALEGDTAVVGAQHDDFPGQDGQGSAYVFERSGSFWTQAAKLVASDGVQSDNFGGAVAVAGDTVVIGAHTDDTAGGNSAGSAYVFVRGHNGNGAWNSGSDDQQAKLTASDADGSAYFGQSVAVEGNMAVVGANFGDFAGLDNPGVAYVFVRSGSPGNASWIEQTMLTAADAGDDDELGMSIALSGNTVLVGSLEDDHAGGSSAGSAYIFECAGAPALPGDINGDGAVDGADFGLLLGAWGTNDPAADLNGDGVVDGADLGLLLGNWTG